MLKKLLIGGAVTLGTAFVIAVGNEVRKEYDKNVDDYNELLEEHKKLRDFVDSCDFYEYKDGSSKKDGDEKNRFVTETEESSDGLKQTIKHDKVSGFSVISYERA